MTTVLTWANVVALLGAGGLFTLYSLIPFAMANDDPQCGPLVRHGFLQVTALAGIAASALFGAWVASRAGEHRGWAAAGVGAAGWAVWLVGVALTLACFFGIAALDTAAAARRRRRTESSSRD